MYETSALSHYVGVTLLVIMFWLAYNGITDMRDSEAILGELQSLSSQELLVLSLPQRKQVMKKVKSFRPLAFPMGPFVDLTFSVPMAIWDEILNQLLFLLSL